MKGLIYFIVILTTFGAIAQKKCTCDSQDLLLFQYSSDYLDAAQINDFLKLYCHKCRDSIEFSQSYNVLLFYITEVHPEKVLKEFEDLNDQQKGVILSIYTHPLLDIDYKLLSESIGRVEGHDEAKRLVLNAIFLR